MQRQRGHGRRPVSSSACSELLYEGEGQPDAIVVSDLPRRGIGAETAELMDEAIKLVLRQRGFRAGELAVGYQSCNDTIGGAVRRGTLRGQREGLRGCEGRSRDDRSVNSACAATQLPILSRRSAGPLAMVSPANTYAGLTRKRPGWSEHPAALYPDGVRIYVRVVAPDNTQGAAGAVVAEDRGATRASCCSAAKRPIRSRWPGPRPQEGVLLESRRSATTRICPSARRCDRVADRARSRLLRGTPGGQRAPAGPRSAGGARPERSPHRTGRLSPRRGAQPGWRGPALHDRGGSGGAASPGGPALPE